MQYLEKNGYVLAKNPGGPTLGIATGSRDRLLQQDGLVFKNLSGTGQLLPYEDWRLSPDERAKDLAGRLSIEQIAGLMLYSSHQLVPFISSEFFKATYGGKSFEAAGCPPWALTDQQREFLEKDGIRHVLVKRLADAGTAARWNNEIQALCEALPFGIPVNISSDPRHSAGLADAEYKDGEGETSKWPQGLGMAATFSPELCHEFATIMAQEYRALGIATALSPQIDLATDPRWMRINDTFGEHTDLATDMARAYCDGLQTTPESPTGWGPGSVTAMAKHWPGGGTGEGGRDAHYVFGKYAVYPGGNFDEHLSPFLEGAFKLNGPTGQAGAVMPYYTVSWNQDNYGENVGNSYSRYIIHDLLREKYGYDGVVCTDWGITADEAGEVNTFGSRCFGTEHLTVAERHLKILLNGVDQFGGNNDSAPIVQAYHLGCQQLGEEAMRRLFQRSATRLLRGMFRCGLFENPYLDAEQSAKTVGSPAYVQAGYAAQLRSVVMLKNKADALPLAGRPKVYVPSRSIGPTTGFFRQPVPAQENIVPVPPSLLAQYFQPVDTPEEADVALVYMESPVNDTYSDNDRVQGGNGYMPASLQYRPYTATEARTPSIAGGDPLEASANRSYKGKTTVTANESDLDTLLQTRRAMGGKPVIVIFKMDRPTVPAEFEPSADAILVHFGVQPQAVLDILAGKAEPTALLPVQMPKDMATVERQYEDVPFDMVPYTDSCGNVYDFGFGLNWQGCIEDERTRRYTKPDEKRRKRNEKGISL